MLDIYILLFKDEKFREEDGWLGRYISTEMHDEIKKYKYDIDKKLKLYGELIARIAIFEKENIELNRIKFLKGKRGKPYVEDCKIKINWSHTKGLVVCAISEKEVGIDTEKIGQADEIIIKSFFSKGERDLIKNKEGKQKDIEFFKIWTKKEAFLKNRGGGLFDLDNIDWDNDLKNEYLYTFCYYNYVVSTYCEDKNVRLINIDEDDVKTLYLKNGRFVKCKEKNYTNK